MSCFNMITCIFGCFSVSFSSFFSRFLFSRHGVYYIGFTPVSLMYPRRGVSQQKSGKGGGGLHHIRKKLTAHFPTLSLFAPPSLLLLIDFPELSLEIQRRFKDSVTRKQYESRYNLSQVMNPGTHNTLSENLSSCESKWFSSQV